MSALAWFAIGIVVGVMLTFLFAALSASRDLEDYHQ
jgi:hypothetical protein